MKNEDNHYRKTIFLAAITAIILLGASVSIFAQKGIGAKYGGARDPQACGDLKGAAPTQAKALNSFICHFEGELANNLNLVEDVSLQVGSGRAYNMNEDINVPNIDVSAKVYPIRGSFKQYQCHLVPGSIYAKDHNCTVYDNPQAEGLCYKNTWGEWKCKMVDSSGKVVQREVAPPYGVGNNSQKDAGKNNAARNNTATAGAQPVDNQRTEKEDDKAAADQNPKPDFSAMNKWLEVTRYEYGDIAAGDKYLYMWVKPKTSSVPWNTLCMQFLDKDGALVAPNDWRYGNCIHFDGSDVGEVSKAKVVTPSEKEMERVVSVKVVRMKQ